MYGAICANWVVPTIIKQTMMSIRGTKQSVKQLSITRPPAPTTSAKKKEIQGMTYKRLGQLLRKKAEKLVRRAISIAPPKTLSLEITSNDKLDILSNVLPVARDVRSKASVSRITSASEGFGQHRTNATSGIKKGFRGKLTA
jgi:hypothetical protein